MNNNKELDIMIKNMVRTFTAVFVLAAIFCRPSFGAEDPAAKKLSKTAQTKNAGILNINNLVSWYLTNGQGQYGPGIQGDGSAFPRGTTHPFFADGIVWGAKAYLDAAHTQNAPFQVIRVGGNTYQSGNREGWINGTGANAVRVSASDPMARMFRIRRDYSIMTDGELAQDALENFHWGSTISDVTDADKAAVTAQYAKDWNEWPVNLGAPYIERNGVSGYQQPPAFGPNFTVDSLIAGNYDEPGVAGADPKSPADQVMWFVANDLDAGAAAVFTESEPMGLEMQMTLWGYKRTDALGNLFFKRIRLINKGGTDVNTARTAKGYVYLDSMFIAQWADPDLGEAGDDLTGCDTSLSVGFIYNGNAVDREYAKFGLPPASGGYDFLAGPIVVSPGDSAVFDLKIRQGFKNLPMTSFAWFSAGAAISDPPFNYEGALRWWKMLRGFVPDASTQADRLYPVGPGETADRFPLSGDPVGRSGKLDGLGETYSFPPGDRRLVLCSGPFQLAAGDTQEIVVGQLAGIGADRLSSISVMKFNDRFVQNTYNTVFQVPKPPAAPNVKVSELNREITLEWGSDFSAVAATEVPINQPGSYEFEGYNVYQLPSASSSLLSAKRLATYDHINDDVVILDEQFDPNTGQILNLPVQFGSNSGVKRYYDFTRDFVRDIDKLWNGQEYYLAVTSYSVSRVPGFLPKTLESTVRVLTVQPKFPFGTTLGTKTGDRINVTHTSSTGVLSDGGVTPVVVDPGASTGKTYNVRFQNIPTTFYYGPDSNGDHDTVTVDLLNWYMITGTDTLARGINQGPTVAINPGTNNLDPLVPAIFGSDLDYPIVKGVFLSVSGPAPGMKAWSIPSGTRRFSPVGGFTGLGLEGFSSAGNPTAYNRDAGTIGMAGQFLFGGIGTTLTVSQYHTVVLKLAAVNATTRWDPRVAQTDTNFSRAYRYLRRAGSAPGDTSFIPWIINTTGVYPYQDFNYAAPFSAWDMSTTPPTRLAIGVFENNIAAADVALQGRWLDGRYWPGNASDHDNSVIREFAFIFASPYTTTPDPALQVDMFANTSTPLMWVMVCNRRSEANWVAGDQFQIVAANVNLPDDVFTFTLPAPGKSVANDKVSVEKITVFPNPYYAFNPAETNRFVRFVTFNNMPPRAKVRIFNLAGQLVRTIDKDNTDQFLRWDLNNQSNFPVASGIYLAYLELTLPADGSVVNKVVKIAVIQEQEVPFTYGERIQQ